MNEITQNCQVDVLIRYFDEDDKQVKVRCLDSRFLGHSTNIDLFEQFANAVNEMNPSFSKKFKIIANEQPLLVGIGSCGLQTIHGAFKAGVQNTGCMLKEVLHSAYQILHDSPARRDDYQKVTESSVIPSDFCCIR